ncbi:DUF4007 family protein, partial [bacterium]|nr:DUF4007 family protein [bacterium]
AWYFFVNEFLPKHQTFTREDLIEGLTDKLSAHSEKHFGPGSKLNVVIARKLIACYTEDYALGSLGIVVKNTNQCVQGEVQTLFGPWDSEEELKVAY